jgi:broad-specificity NMP kinase
MKILITGVSGTGKSTMAKELRKRNIFSIDFSDIRGMCSWQDKQTKEKIEEYNPILSDEWFDSKHYICDLKKLKEILDQHKDIVMTGVASGNHTEYFPFFDRVILLQCNPETFIDRMKTRIAPYGKTKAEQDDAIKWQKEFDPLLLSQGAIPINTEGNIDTVVDKIIGLITTFS